MDVNSFKEELKKDIESIGYHLYSVSYKKKDNILEILIEESLDLDGISKVSELISAFMDKYDTDFDEYLLDVSCAGCERKIRNEEELTRAVNSYIHTKTKDNELDGTLKSFKDNKLTIEYLDKTRKKTLVVDYADIKMIRYAVKF